MSRREAQPIVRKHLLIYQDDWDFLSEHFGDTTGISKAVRTIVHSWVGNLRARAEQTASPIQLDEVPDEQPGTTPEPNLSPKPHP